MKKQKRLTFPFSGYEGVKIPEKKSNLEVFVMIAWLIWYSRNQFYHHKIIEDPIRILATAKSSVEFFKELQPIASSPWMVGLN